MKNYKSIKAKINKWYDSRIKEIKSGCSFCDYKSGVRLEKPTDRQQAAEVRRLEKKRAERLEFLERVANAPALLSVSVVTDWVKNRTWGHNPHAFATITTTEGASRTEGRASGCGYDKYSAAVTSAICHNPSVLRVLCENLNKLKKEGRYPHSCEVWDCCGMPTLCTNGSGIETLRGVFICIGFKYEENRQSRQTDFLRFWK